MRNLNSAFSTLRTALLCASAALLVVACGNDDDKEQNPNPGNSTQSTGTGSGDGTNGTNGDDTKKALGETCADAAECMTNICREYSVDDPTNPGQKLSGKTCSACNANTDCTDPEAGNLCAPAIADLSNPNTLHYACSKGALGDGCLDNTNCAEERKCGAIPGTQLTTCGECLTKDDCKDPAKPLCSFKLEGTTAYRYCTNKLPDGEQCSGEEGSDDECENYCATLSLEGVPVKIAVCSPCKDDSHCAEGETCTPPSVDIASQKAVPAKCEAKEAETTAGESSSTGEATTGTESATDMTTTTTDETT